MHWFHPFEESRIKLAFYTLMITGIDNFSLLTSYLLLMSNCQTRNTFEYKIVFNNLDFQILLTISATLASFVKRPVSEGCYLQSKLLRNSLRLVRFSGIPILNILNNFTTQILMEI